MCVAKFSWLFVGMNEYFVQLSVSDHICYLTYMWFTSGIQVGYFLFSTVIWLVNDSNAK